MLFPTVCIDGFFEDPKEIRELAFSLPRKSDPEGLWPGERTAPLYEVAPEYNEFFNKKLMSAFYDFKKHNITWQVDSYFQFIHPHGPTQDVNEGWVHRDHETVLAGVVYLNEKPELSAGTSLFSKNSVMADCIYADNKHEFFKDQSSVDKDTYVEKLKENNSRFTETLTVGNVYNRMVCYDGAYYHRANSFLCGDEPRLTHVFFVKNLNADWYPIPSMRSA